MKKKISFEVFRFRPSGGKPGVFQEFGVDADETTTVLDCLEYIRLHIDRTLVYRHSCHHSCCGTCALRINERERLACITSVLSLDTGIVKLEPIKGLAIVSDLAVDMKHFYADIPDDLDYLRPAEHAGIKMPFGIKAFTRFENCIECGSCVSACPVTPKNNNFIGPAGLAAIDNEIKKHPDKKASLLKLSKNERGVRLCERAMECNRVCPTRVFPARHIKELTDME
jgi:succinate dehydrogenase / fumarate reductase, iron-sulfur subunit